MKTNEETINSLLERRDAFYRQRKKCRALASACLLVVVSVSALSVCGMLSDNDMNFNLNAAARETSCEGASVGSYDGLFVKSDDYPDYSHNDTTRITVNELNSVPTRFMSRYFSTVYKSMTAEEVLSHFRVQLDVDELFDEYDLQEEKLEHGFYVKTDGTSNEQDFFLFQNEDKSTIIGITIQSSNSSAIYLLKDYYKDPVCSYISGKKVYIYRYQDEENEELYCEFCFRDNVAISIRMRNMGTANLSKLVEYLVNQEPVFFDATIIP